MRQATNVAGAAGKTLRGIVRALVGVVGIGCVFLLVDSQQLLSALSEVSLGDIIRLILISGALITVSVWKWGAFLSHLGIKSSFEKLFGLYLVGYFVNTFTPSFIGGDVVRSLALGSSVNRAHAVSATMLERYTGIVAMLLIAGIATCLSDVVTTPIVLIVVASIVGCAVATVMVAVGFVKRVAGVCKLPGKALRIVDAVHEGLALGAGDPRLLSRAFMLSVVFHLLTIVNTVVVAHAIGWSDVSWRGLLVVVPLILLVGAVPISPQGLGIQEGAFVFFLHSVGATTGQALAVALVLRAKSYVLAICGALVWWLRKNAWEAESARRSPQSRAIAK